MKELNSKFPFEDLSERIKYTIGKLETEINVLSESGWTMPMEFTPRAVIELIDIKDKEKIDEFFKEYYCEENGIRFNALARSIVNDEKLIKWKSLIDECIIAYNNGLYKITIPSLLSILEGLLSEMLLPDQMDNIRLKRLCREQEEKVQAGSIRKIQWASVRHFIDRLYDKIAFGSERPILINRHWILHGRDTVDWRIEDSLRLFHAINSIKDMKGCL